SLTSDVIAGAGAAAPTEALRMAFDSLTEATSAQIDSWNQNTNTNIGPAAPAGVTLAPLPSLVAPALTLTLKPFPNSDVLAFTLGLYSYQFFAENVRIIDSGGVAVAAFFQDLEVSAPLSGVSPGLFFSLFSPGHYSTAVLTQRNAAGDPVAEWV